MCVTYAPIECEECTNAPISLCHTHSKGELFLVSFKSYYLCYTPTQEISSCDVSPISSLPTSSLLRVDLVWREVFRSLNWHPKPLSCCFTLGFFFRTNLFHTFTSPKQSSDTKNLLQKWRLTVDLCFPLKFKIFCR